MGEFAEEFIAVELWKINRRYVDVEGDNGVQSISLPEITPKFANGDLQKLLQNIYDVLRPMIGTIYSHRVVNQIERKFSVSIHYAE